MDGAASDTGITRRFAEFVAQTGPDDIPREVLRTYDVLLLDSLATSLAASGLAPGAESLVATAEAIGGTGRCTVFGVRPGLSLAAATLANGGFVHALNFDGAGARGAHVGLVTPIALALAEDRPADGRRLLAALVVGCEVMTRLEVGSRPLTADTSLGGWLPGQLLAYFGAVATGANLLGLTVDEAHHAFGYALMQAAGTREVMRLGDSPAKGFYGAFPSLSATVAVLLAANGADAAVAAIEGPSGLFGLYLPGATAEVTDLGREYHAAELEFKRWPVSGHIDPYIDAALRLHAREPDLARQLRRVETSGDPGARQWFEPAAERRAPSNVVSAGNSVQYALAVALCRGEVRLSDYTETGITDPHVLEAAGTIDHRLTDGPHHVVVQLRDGSELREIVDDARPSGRGAEDHDRLFGRAAEKLAMCNSFARRPLPPASLTAACSAVDRLEAGGDPDDLFASMRAW